jgi:hypothetical protein
MRMKAGHRFVAAGLAALSVVASSAHAANYQGIVSSVTPYNGKVYVAIGDGGFDGAASACAYGGVAMVFSIDPNTAFGRSLLAVALAAKLTGKVVYAVGDGACAAGSMLPGSSSEGLAGLDLKG